MATVTPRTVVHTGTAVRPRPGSSAIRTPVTAVGDRPDLARLRRWLDQGLLPGEQAMPGATWRIRLTNEVRARFVPEIPDGYLPLAEAAEALGCARQTVLHKVQRGELRAIQVIDGRRKGLRIEVPHAGLDRLLNE